MRSFVFMVFAACSPFGSSQPPDAHKIVDLTGDIPCGTHTCHTGQVCVTETAGHTCWTNDAGVGEYGIHDQFCEDVPADCDGSPSCDCLACEGLCFGVYERDMECGCF